MRLNSKLKMIGIVLVSSLMLSNCGEDEIEQAKSMSELQEENGMPVVLETVEPQNFKKELTFYSRLTGIQQTTRSSAVGGRIDKINYKVGDVVKQDAVVVQFPEDSPAVQYEQAKAAYQNSKKNFERMKALLDAGETSQANYDGAETKYLVDKRNYEMAKQALFIDAPYDGVIVEVMVNESDGVDSKIPLFTIARLEKMKAKVWADQTEIDQIEIGMTAETVFNGKKFVGKVTDKSIAIDPMRRAYYAEVEFDNPDRELSPGLSSDISIKVYENNVAIIVPRNLIQNSSEEKYVFVAENGKAVLRPIETGEENSLSVEVVEGLSKGDKLIVKGASRLTDGQKINEVQ